MENVQNLRRKARERDKVQRFTFVFDEGPEPMLICSVIVPDSGSREDLENGRRVIVTGF